MGENSVNWDDIAYKCRTDKSSRYRHDNLDHDVPAHGYADYYETRLSGRPVLSVLEIGVLKGDSLRFWEEVFPQAQILGLDINPDCAQYAAGRISVLTMDAGDPRQLQKFIGESCMFDFIVDDGSHDEKDITNALVFMWGKLNPGGLYAIEDTACENYRYPGLWTTWMADLRDWVSYVGGTMSAHPARPHKDLPGGTAVYFIDKALVHS
jgi:trans-aconitate methyltransferase